MDPLLSNALEYMSRSTIPCPDVVKSRIAALRIPEEVSGTRIGTNWRLTSQGSGSERGSGRGRGSTISNRGSWVKRPYGSGPHFGNKTRTNVTTEERIMDRIRDKMNKFSVLTYDATKTWLSQLLDNGETGFLTEFITLVFEKAASEPSFCAIYAQLINELCVGFPHLITDIRRIFTEFMNIFTVDEPDVSAVEYSAFVAFRERRRFRRGYAAFIGEVASKSDVALTITDVNSTCTIIIEQIMLVKRTVGQGLLCEELADCLTSLVKSSKMTTHTNTLLNSVTLAKDRQDSPSLTNKARFALMDICDLLESKK